MTTTTDIILGTSLDELLSPLDALARTPRPRPATPAEIDQAYILALIAAELTANGVSPWLLTIARDAGVEPEEALTIARAFSSAIVRVAQTIGTP
jgi:hypothetical protein